jgi:predicted GTPase
MNLFDQVVSEFKKLKDYEDSQPIVVSVLGQTGTGKSSLINALFGTKFETSDVRPCTMDIQKHREPIGGGRFVVFYDLPGIGESEDADDKYIQKYCEVIKSSNVILWTVHSDSRSTTFDKSSIDNILKLLDEPNDVEFLNKLIIVMTKCDLIFPDPWLFVHDKKSFKLIPQHKTKETLDEKSKFIFEQLLEEYSDRIKSEVVYDGEFDLQLEGFSLENQIIRYNGILDCEKALDLSNKYPIYKEIFEKLNKIYMPVPCSSNFRYNMSYLIYVIVNRLDFAGLLRFRSFISDYQERKIDMNKIGSLSNVMVVDKTQREVRFSMIEYVKEQGLL